MTTSTVPGANYDSALGAGGGGLIYGIGLTASQQGGQHGEHSGGAGYVDWLDNGIQPGYAKAYIFSPNATPQEQMRWHAFTQWYFDKPTVSLSQSSALWNKVIGIVSQVNKADPTQRLTVWQVLEQQQQSGQRPGSGGGGGGRGGHGSSSTSTSTSYSFTGKQEAGAVLDSAWEQLLGQGATEQQKADFLKQLHAEQAANPTSVTQRQSISANGQSQSSSVSSHTTSVSPQADAITMAQNQPDYGAYQSATTYMDAMLSALSGPK
jgi:hypothetical protein